ncbi:hypothetical protein BJF90_32160 [Pseudonocardia sp. CNS-004]|nr:hypothetical protein BJF90_32160 [Pseudonocardia sp. CNS-004]
MDRLMHVLVVNAGSSSIKVRLLDDDELLHRTDLSADRGRPEPGALEQALDGLGRIDAVGHRVVHGGPRRHGPVLVDDAVLAELDELAALAPLHQPPALAALRATRSALPGVPAIACFDTAFHAGMPAAASTYAIPARWRNELGVRRYGFHGLAHEWAARRAAVLAGPRLRTVVAHLGSGASACAVAWDGDQPRSVDTTMGFTPTAGLVMGSRSGDLDPAVPLWLVESAGLAATDVAGVLDRESGLAGLAGSADMRDVLAGERAGQPDAVLAVEVWLHRLRAASPRWPPPSTDSTCSCSAVASVSAPTICGGAPSPGSPSSAWPSTSTSTQAPTRTARPTSAPTVPPHAPWWSTAARSSSSQRRYVPSSPEHTRSARCRRRGCRA